LFRAQAARILGRAAQNFGFPGADSLKHRVTLIARDGLLQVQYLALRSEIDDSIIGGLVLQVGNRVLDASVRSRLYKLRREVLQAA